jgi:polysaccharide biosynthesis/export protein
MWRNTTVKNRQTRSRFTALFAGLALQSAVLTVPGVAQFTTSGPGTQTVPSTLTGAASLPGAAKSGLAGQGLGPVALPKGFSEIRVEPGDLLSVNVYDTPELTDAYRVDPAGNLSIPMCGKVKVEGLTAPEVARLVESALVDQQILVRPQVNVDVQQYAGHYVTVLGEVALPGRISVIIPTPLSEVLAQAGGVTPISGTHIKIRHGDNDSAPEDDVVYSRTHSNPKSDSILVRPGDSVIIPRAGIVYVLGAVARPGGYVMQEDGSLNVAEALALSGGTQMQAHTSGLRVIRRNPDGTVLDFSLSYDGIAKGAQTPLELQARDIVYVPMDKLKATFASTANIIGEAASAGIYAVR